MHPGSLCAGWGSRSAAGKDSFPTEPPAPAWEGAASALTSPTKEAYRTSVVSQSSTPRVLSPRSAASSSLRVAGTSASCRRRCPVVGATAPRRSSSSSSLAAPKGSLDSLNLSRTTKTWAQPAPPHHAPPSLSLRRLPGHRSTRCSHLYWAPGARHKGSLAAGLQKTLLRRSPGIPAEGKEVWPSGTSQSPALLPEISEPPVFLLLHKHSMKLTQEFSYVRIHPHHTATQSPATG